MNHWTGRLLSLAAPLLLTGCLWGPGKFASDLTLRKDGSFVLDYRGEIVLENAEEMAKRPWKPTIAHCMKEDGSERPTPDGYPDVERAWSGSSALGMTFRMLARIPETQRAAFELLRVEGLSHEQAARVLGTTVNAVKLRAFRAYSAIRAVLAARDSRAQEETVS